MLLMLVKGYCYLLPNSQLAKKVKLATIRLVTIVFKSTYLKKLFFNFLSKISISSPKL